MPIKKRIVNAYSADDLNREAMKEHTQNTSCRQVVLAKYSDKMSEHEADYHNTDSMLCD